MENTDYRMNENYVENNAPDDFKDPYKEALHNFWINTERIIPNSYTSILRGLFIQCIYTFKNGQKIWEIPIVESVVSDKETMTEFLTNALTEDEFNNLVKISTCIYHSELLKNLPQWFNKCDGKFYFTPEWAL